MRTVLFVLLLVSAGGLYGQGGVPDPPMMNRVYYCYRPDSLVSLEQAEGRMKNKMKVFGFGSNETAIRVEADRSPIRIRVADTLRFAIKLGAMMDPSMTLKLYRFEPQKGGREAVISNQSRSGKGSSDKNQLLFDIQKIGNDSYYVIPPGNLGAGEYGFMNVMMMKGSGFNMSYTFFAFGIDP
jgi:hypothetical protein